MKFRYLGTAAAEGFPGMFCVCDACRRAKIAGGRNIRGRSQAIIDEKLLIDFPADTCMRVLNGTLDLPSIHDCIITHRHSDHLYAPDLEMRKKGMCKADGEIFRVYASRPASDIIKEQMDIYGLYEVVELHAIKPFDVFTVAGEYKVTALPATHDPKVIPDGGRAVFYIIEKDGKRILYAHDTGYFSEETWKYLEENRPYFSFASLDCTGGPRSAGANHMGLSLCKEVTDRLKACGCFDGSTRVVLNHFSHNGGLIHDELVPVAAEYGFEVSYDGFELEI